MYELNKIAFGSFLAQLRREKGMTQKELAACLYVSDKAVSKWERGVSRSGSASVASSTVIILVREAGAASSPDRFRARTCPVRASISSACRLDVPSRIFC